MAFLQFPKVLLTKIFDTAEEVNLGSFKATDSQELEHIRVIIFRNGTAGGSETFTLKVYSSSDLTSAVATSDVVTYSTVTNNLSWVRFDFNRENINKEITYFATLTPASYTRNADTFYFGVPFDFPDPIYGTFSGTNFTDHGIAMQIFGFK